MSSDDTVRAAAPAELLRIEGLSIAFRLQGGWCEVVHDVGLTVGRGETVGLVGESGSGKTVVSQAVLGLTQRRGGRVTAGSIVFDGCELVGMSRRALGDVRGARIGMIFQQPTRCLNPAYTVGDQIAETVRRHRGLSRRAAWARAVEVLDRVQIPDAARRASEHPHTYSGGMAQRVMIAMAIACEPDLVIADEPTTALDVTVQAKILDLLRELQAESGVSLLLISHNLAVIAEMCERVTVMYAGEVVEEAPIDAMLHDPQHPYTAGLLGAIPVLGGGGRLQTIPGAVPPPDEFPAACRFARRCPHVVPERCEVTPPLLVATPSGTARCCRVGEISLRGVPVG